MVGFDKISIDSGADFVHLRLFLSFLVTQKIFSAKCVFFFMSIRCVPTLRLVMRCQENIFFIAFNNFYFSSRNSDFDFLLYYEGPLILGAKINNFIDFH